MRIGIVNAQASRARSAPTSPPLGARPGLAWSACDGAEAIELAQREPPDLIVLDLRLPP